MTSPDRDESVEIQPWDSDHTALVHVLWEARWSGVLDADTDCDALASQIMRSKWMTAVRAHAMTEGLR